MKERKVWRLTTHHEEPAKVLAWVKANNRIAVGWGEVGDIGSRSFESKEAITAAIREASPDITNAPDGGASLWRFLTEVEVGDLIILSGETAREFVVEVEGDYEWSGEAPLGGDYNHQRVVRKRYLNPDKVWKAGGGRPAPGQSPRGVLVRLTRTTTHEQLDEM